MVACPKPSSKPPQKSEQNKMKTAAAKKKAKLAAAATAAPVKDLLNSDLPQRVRSLQEEFQKGKPYKYVAIQKLCTDEAARHLHEEIRQLQGTMKETDLFKVIQTGDLANADESDPVHAEKLKYLLALRRELNTEKFRQMIEEITGCGPLSSQIDLSANAYCQGCHLLCHDDVIGSRRVSYIVYLSDPDDEWRDEDGGRLELYPSDANGLPEAEPSVRVLPTFNSLAMFVVEPGVSYHSVEEVYAEDKPRISLQGWFHAEKPPEGFEKATLQQILNPAVKAKLMAGEHADLAAHVAGTENDEFLSQADIDELKEWVNNDYLSSKSLELIREKCATEDNCVSLEKFMRSDYADRIRNAIRTSETLPINPQTWKVVGPAHLRRHLELLSSFTKAPESAEFFLHQLKERMSSPAFTRFLRHCIGDLLPQSRQAWIRRFRKGSDYTVAHAHSDISVVDATLCFVLDDEEGAIDVWRSGDVGGFELYLNREEDGKGDVAVYAKDQESEGVVSIDPAFGTLCLVYRDESRMRFVKYLSKTAPSDRYDVAFTYQVQDIEGDDEGDAQNEEEEEA